MKKLTKIVLVCGVAMFFCGLLIALTGLALGGNPNIVGSRLYGMGILHNEGWNDDYQQEADTEPSERAENPPAEEKAEAAELPSGGEYEIKTLDFSFDVGDIRIISGDDFQLRYGNDKTRSYFYESRKDGVWTISSRQRKWRWLGFLPFNDDALKLTVVLPHDFVAERIDMEIGAGILKISRLSAERLSLEVGVGDCQIDSFLAKEARLEVGVGNLMVEGFQADKADLEVGMGNMELYLARPLSQYRCELSVGLGNIALGNNDYSGVAALELGAADAPYGLNVNCGLGSISLREPITIDI